MSTAKVQDSDAQITLQPVTKDNWRDVIKITVTEPQYEFVGRPDYYLTLCAYEGKWHPLAIYLDDQIIGFIMWAVDPADQSCWLGGITIDHRYQGRGYGRRAIKTAVNTLAHQHGYQHFALSYKPGNTVGKHLYRSLGFVETAEWQDDEIIARMILKTP